jgi:hypothetical protein
MTLKTKRLLFLIPIVVVIGLLVAFGTLSTNQSSTLDELFGYNSTDFTSFEFKQINAPGETWSTNEEQSVEELSRFLSQYEVEQMKDFEWNSDVSKEKGFEVGIFLKNKPILASIFDDRIHLYGDGYYKVANGPIDMEWVTKFNEKYQDSSFNE